MVAVVLTVALQDTHTLVLLQCEAQGRQVVCSVVGLLAHGRRSGNGERKDGLVAALNGCFMKHFFFPERWEMAKKKKKKKEKGCLLVDVCVYSVRNDYSFMKGIKKKTGEKEENSLSHTHKKQQQQQQMRLSIKPVVEKTRVWLYLWICAVRNKQNKQKESMRAMDVKFWYTDVR